MGRYEKAVKLSPEEFGVKKETFGAVVEVLCVAYAEKHKRRVGMPSCLWWINFL